MKGWRLWGTIFLAMVLASGARSYAQPAVSLSHIDDPGFSMVFYALNEGKIKSDRVKLTLYPMAVPALIQVMGTKQTDITQTSAIAYAKAVKRGLDAKIIALGAVPRDDGYGIFVRSDSGITKVADLKGKRLGVHSLGAANVVHAKVVLAKAHKLNMALVGGDINAVEAPPLQLVTMLEQGKLESIYAFGIGFYQSAKRKELRLLLNAGAEYQKAFGENPPVAAYVAFTDRIKQKPEAMKETQRLIFESAKYYVQNADAVSKAVAAKSRLDPEYLRWWGVKAQEDPNSLEERLVNALAQFFKLSNEIGELEYMPNVREMLWKGYWE